MNRDGFALGGPGYPWRPSTSQYPSAASCSRFNTQLHAWAKYQNSHRPASYTKLPSSADRQFLALHCNIDYDATH